MSGAVKAVGGVVAIAAGGFFGMPWLAKLGGATVLSAASQALTPKQKGSIAAVSGSQQMVRQPITYRQVIYGRTRVSGPITYIEATSSGQWLEVLITLSGHPVEEIESVWFNDTQLSIASNAVQTAPWTNLAQVYTGDGTPAGDAQLLYALGQNTNWKWSGANLQRGCAKIYVRLYWQPGVWPGGLPKISAVVKGRQVYDPREVGHDYDDPSTWEWSSNAALCQADYLAGYQVRDDGTREPVGLGCSDTEIGWTTLAASANTCDEAVALAAGGTEDRYSCHGALDLGRTHRTNIEELLTASAGKAIWSGGVWTLLVGAYSTPTVTITAGDLDSPVQVQARVSRRELFNGVKGTYISEAAGWQPVDAPAYQDASAVTEDNEEKWKDASFPFSKSVATIQRLMKIDVEEARRQQTVTIGTNLSMLKVRCGDVVQFTLDRLGYSAKPFEVAGWKLVERGGGTPRLGIDMVLRETASTVYDWDSADEEAELEHPATTLPDPSYVAPPGAPAVAEELYETRLNRVAARAVLTWSASSSGSLVDYLISYRTSGASDWVELGTVPAAGLRQFSVEDIAPGTYDFRIQGRNSLGAVSAGAETLSRQIAGLLDPPTEPQNVTLSTMGGLAVIRWDRSEDLDVRMGGTILIRWSPDTSGASWNASTTVGDPVDGSATMAVVPLRSGTYLLKAKDSSGIQSTGTSSVSTDGATIQGFTTTGTLTEHSSFSGTKTDMSVSGSDLVLDAAGTSGSYAFATAFNFGARTRVRLRAHVKATVVDSASLWDDAAGNWDSRGGLWDGDDLADGNDAQVWVRTCPDDPTGTPTWSAWQRVDSAEHYAWGVEAKLLASATGSSNIQVSELTLTAEEPA